MISVAKQPKSVSIRANPLLSVFHCQSAGYAELFIACRGAECAEVFSFMRWLTIVHIGMLRWLFLSATDARGLNTDLWEQNTTKARIEFLFSQSRIMKARMLVFKITPIRDHPRHPCSLFFVESTERPSRNGVGMKPMNSL